MKKLSGIKRIKIDAEYRDFVSDLESIISGVDYSSDDIFDAVSIALMRTRKIKEKVVSIVRHQVRGALRDLENLIR